MNATDSVCVIVSHSWSVDHVKVPTEKVGVTYCFVVVVVECVNRSYGIVDNNCDDGDDDNEATMMMMILMMVILMMVITKVNYDDVDDGS